MDDAAKGAKPMNAEQAIELMDNWELEYGPKTRKAIAALITTQSRELEQAQADCAAYREALTLAPGLYGIGYRAGKSDAMGENSDTERAILDDARPIVGAIDKALSAQSGRAILDRLAQAEAVAEAADTLNTFLKHNGIWDDIPLNKALAAYRKAKEGRGDVRTR